MEDSQTSEMLQWGKWALLICSTSLWLILISDLCLGRSFTSRHFVQVFLLFELVRFCLCLNVYQYCRSKNHQSLSPPKDKWTLSLPFNRHEFKLLYAAVGQAFCCFSSVMSYLSYLICHILHWRMQLTITEPKFSAWFIWTWWVIRVASLCNSQC